MVFLKGILVLYEKDFLKNIKKENDFLKNIKKEKDITYLGKYPHYSKQV